MTDINKRKLVNILIAEDDPDDRLMTQDAFRENHLKNELFFVEDGEQLMNYLNGKGKYKDREKFPLPGLILLDLNMPRKDGREALKEIKSDQLLRRIPIIVLTTSKAEEDVLKTYDLGVNCFITKPVTFQGLLEVTNIFGKYWFEIVELPIE
jgi:CheY-like chemotaxis protein